MKQFQPVAKPAVQKTSPTALNTHMRPHAQRGTQSVLTATPVARHRLDQIAIVPQEHLTITSPNDISERDADHLASSVVRRLTVSQESGTSSQSFSLPPPRQVAPQPLTTAPQNNHPALNLLSRTIQQRRGQGKPLAMPLRTAMEQTLNADLSHVRIHTDALSDQLNHATSSYAFTSGQDIFFRRNTYSPQSPRGLDLLAHEVAHVMQQQNRNPHHLLLQRRFGVELQTSNQFIKAGETPFPKEREVAFENKHLGFTLEADEGPTPDATDLEFVTKPFDEVLPMLSAVKGAAQLALNLAKGETNRTGMIGKEGLEEEKEENVNKVHMRKKGQPFEDGQWLQNVAIQVNDPSFKAAMQATVGVPLAHLSDFLQDQLAAVDKEQGTKYGEKLANAYQNLKQQHSPRVKSLVHAIIMYIQRAQKPNTRYQEIMGSSTYGYEHAAWVKVGDESDFQAIQPEGPKYNISPLMARTDFHSMYASLDPKEKEEFNQTVFAQSGSDLSKSFLAAIDGELQQNNFVFRDPYRADENLEGTDPGDLLPADTLQWAEAQHKKWKLSHGPRLRDWLLSIRTGHKYTQGQQQASLGKDMLSAPPGLASRKPENVAKYPFPKQEEEPKSSYYGMGAYGMDTHDPQAKEPLAVFEHRGVSKILPEQLGGQPPAIKWVDAARFVVAEQLREGDN